ncbi:MAG: glycosyltransferase family 2 protein [Thermaerobacterales bacterium]
MRSGGERAVRIVAVVPAYNEAETVGRVIDVIHAVPQIDEVFVISDGSTDETSQVARQHGATVIELEQNLGKGGALKVGIDHADADVFLFLDADLVGLRPEHVEKLIQPLIAREADMSLGRFDGGRMSTDLAQVMAPYLSGQRAVHRDVLLGVSGMEIARFGVEVALTRHIREQEVRVAEVRLDHLTHRTKEEKLGLIRGFTARMKMYWEILRFTQEEIAREIRDAPGVGRALNTRLARGARRRQRRRHP